MNGNEKCFFNAKRRKAVAVILAVLFVVIFALSLWFIADNHDHECCGENCSVCAVLRVAEQISGGAEKAAAALLFAFVFVAVLSLRKFSARFFSAITPISLKDVLTI